MNPIGATRVKSKTTLPYGKHGCERCGLETRGRHPICQDCRFVLSYDPRKPL